MRTEELTRLASAHSVNLQGRLAHGVRRDTIRRRGVNGRSYEALAAPSAQRANGRASHSQLRPWSIAELGQAAAGVPQIPFAAACYALAGDRSVYWSLWSALEQEAQQLRVRHSWPAQVRGRDGRPRFYCERLAALVLDEDANRDRFLSVPALYWVYVGVNESTWQRALYARFDSLKLLYAGWIGEAMSILQPRLEELEAD